MLWANLKKKACWIRTEGLTIEVLVKFVKDPRFDRFPFILVEWVPPNAHAHLIHSW